VPLSSSATNQIGGTIAQHLSAMRSLLLLSLAANTTLPLNQTGTGTRHFPLRKKSKALLHLQIKTYASLQYTLATHADGSGNGGHCCTFAPCFRCLFLFDQPWKRFASPLSSHERNLLNEV